MPTDPKYIDLARHYDADTLRALTPENYEALRRLYAESHDNYEALAKEFGVVWGQPMEKQHDPVRQRLADLITNWSTLQPLIQRHLDIIDEIRSLVP